MDKRCVFSLIDLISRKTDASALEAVTMSLCHRLRINTGRARVSDFLPSSVHIEDTRCSRGLLRGNLSQVWSLK